MKFLQDFSEFCSTIFAKNIIQFKGSKGKRKRLRVGGGTKTICGGTVLSGDDHSQSHPDSASKTPWTPRYLSDLKSSNIYNRNAIEAPAEVYFYFIILKQQNLTYVSYLGFSCFERTLFQQ